MDATVGDLNYKWKRIFVCYKADLAAKIKIDNCKLIPWKYLVLHLDHSYLYCIRCLRSRSSEPVILATYLHLWVSDLTVTLTSCWTFTAQSSWSRCHACRWTAASCKSLFLTPGRFTTATVSKPQVLVACPSLCPKGRPVRILGPCQTPSPCQPLLTPWASRRPVAA